MPKSRYFFGRHWRAAAFESDPRTKMARTTSTNDNAVVSPLHLATLERASQNNTSSASVICLLGVISGGAGLLAARQANLDKRTSATRGQIAVAAILFLCWEATHSDDD